MLPPSATHGSWIIFTPLAAVSATHKYWIFTIFTDYTFWFLPAIARSKYRDKHFVVNIFSQEIPQIYNQFKKPSVFSVRGYKRGQFYRNNRINYLCTYDLYSPVHNVLDACISITWGSGWALEFPSFFETLWNGNEPIGELLLGPKNSGIPGSNPLPLPQVMDMHTSKTLCTGLYRAV